MDYKINYEAAIQQLKDLAMLDLLAAMAPDEKSKEITEKYLTIFVKNGVPITTAVKIAMDIANIDKEEQ